MTGTRNGHSPREGDDRRRVKNWVVTEDEGKAGPSRLKVLLFDEDTKKRKYYLSTLRMCGLREILIADSVEDAVQAVVSNSIDLVVTTPLGETLRMELLDELRSLGAVGSIPFVTIMAEVDVKSGLHMLSRGVDHILTDPLSQQAIEAMAKKLFRERFGNDQLDKEIQIARGLLDQGKLDEAKMLYTLCLEMRSGVRDQLFEIYLGLAQIGTEKKEWLEAESYLFLALEIAKSESNRVEAHWLLSVAFFRYGKFYEKRGMQEKAYKSYQTSLQLNPYQVASLKPLLIYLLQQDDFPEITRLLDEARANFPPYSEPLGEIAETLNGMAVRAQVLGMPAYARKLYNQLATIQHDRVVVHQDVSDHFLNAGKISLVLQNLREVSARVKSPEILHRIGSVLVDVEKRNLFASQVSRSSEMDLSFFKDLDSPKIIKMAHKAFQEGLLLNPGHVQLRLGVAYCLMREGEHAALSELLEKLREGGKAGKKLFALVIDMLLEGRLYDLVQKWIRDAISKFPQDVVFYECAARCFRAQRKPELALDALKRALAIAPNHAGINLALARLYEELHQPNEAAVYYQRAKKLAPEGTSKQGGSEAMTAGRSEEGKRSKNWFQSAK